VRVGAPDLGRDEEVLAGGDEPRAHGLGGGLPDGRLGGVVRGRVEVAVAELDGAQHRGADGVRPRALHRRAQADARQAARGSPGRAHGPQLTPHPSSGSRRAVSTPAGSDLTCVGWANTPAGTAHIYSGELVGWAGVGGKTATATRRDLLSFPFHLTFHLRRSVQVCRRRAVLQTTKVRVCFLDVQGGAFGVR
jgi:hypothetical protein